MPLIFSGGASYGLIVFGMMSAICRLSEVEASGLALGV